MTSTTDDTTPSSMPQFSSVQLRRIRQAKGLTGTELAYLAGLSAFSIKRYEDAKHGNAPNTRALTRLAAVLDVSVADFFVSEAIVVSDTDEVPRRRLARLVRRNYETASTKPSQPRGRPRKDGLTPGSSEAKSADRKGKREQEARRREMAS